MLVSTMLDLGLSLHVHIVAVMVPPSAVPVPTPVPMAAVGMNLDIAGVAVGAAIGMAASGGPGLVLVNGLPVTNTGTIMTNQFTMPHNPAPGVAFIPPPCPANDATLMFGSLGVTVGGSLAVRMGDIGLSCSDPVRLPTTIVLAIPKGAPFLINRPMVPDLKGMAIAAGMRAGLRALGRAVRAGGKLMRQLRRAQKRSAGWGKVSQALRRAIDRMAPRRYRDWLKNAACFVTGHPVDVATGRVFTETVDFVFPGPLPLEFKRIYSSSLSWRNGPLGYGWSHPLDQAIWVERGKIVYKAEDGREIEFLTDGLDDRILRAGEAIYEPMNRLTLHACGENRFTITTIEGIVHEFAPVEGDAERARLMRIATRDGIEMTCAYDERARLERIVDSGGRPYRFVYDGLDRLREIWAPHETEGSDRIMRYGFDEHDLIAATDALGHAQRYVYKEHLLVKETDRAGFSFHFQYNGNNHHAKCVRTWGDGGVYDHEIHYDEPNRKTIVVDSLGFVKVYQRNEVGLVIEEKDALQRPTRYAYDPESAQMIGVTDALGRRTWSEVDARGNMTMIEYPDGARLQIEYEADRPVRVVNEVGAEWLCRYDENGRVRSVMTPFGGEMTFRYKSGLLREMADVMGAKTTFEYDEAKNLSVLRHANGAEEKHVHDVMGRVIAHCDARGGMTRCKRDALGRIVEVFEADGNHVRVKYDPEGNPLEIVDHRRAVRLGYAGFHEVVRRDESGDVVEMRYDTESRLEAIVNEAGEEHVITRDPVGNVYAERGFDGRSARYFRDAAGQVVKMMQPSGKTVRYDLDARGRCLAIHTGDGKAERFKYRADGALMAAENATIRVEFERDVLGNVLEERQGPHVIRHRYDLRGAMTEVTSSLGFDGAFVRDVMGDLEAIALGTGVDRWRMWYERDAAGLEKKRHLPGGIAVRTGRDSVGRPKEVSFLDELNELRRIRYAWEPGDLLAERHDSKRGLTRYGHDLRGRLTRATPEGKDVQWRRPTPSGAIQKAMQGEPQRYGKSGMLLSSGNVEYEYDPAGRRRAKKVDGYRYRDAYQWDDRDRLVAITSSDGKTVQFAYDALGRRVKKTCDKAEVVFVWDGDVLLHELSTTEGPITWVHEPGTFTVVAKVQGLRRYAIVADQVGAPCAAFDEWGGIAWQGAIDVFGQADADIAKTTLPWRFPGQYEDVETGLVYNRFRYYDPETGAYISKDPIGLLGGLNLYGYVADPLSWTDVLGLSGCTRIYRGTNIGNELDIFAETGYLMSASARTAYRAATGAGVRKGKALAEAMRASQAAHKRHLAAWKGSLNDYIHAHALLGDEYTKAFGEQSLISFTTDPSVTSRFGNTVFTADVPTRLLIPQTLDGSTEAEVLLLHMLKVR